MDPNAELTRAVEQLMQAWTLQPDRSTGPFALLLLVLWASEHFLGLLSVLGAAVMYERTERSLVQEMTTRERNGGLSTLRGVVLVALAYST